MSPPRSPVRPRHPLVVEEIAGPDVRHEQETRRIVHSVIEDLKVGLDQRVQDVARHTVDQVVAPLLAEVRALSATVRSLDDFVRDKKAEAAAEVNVEARQEKTLAMVDKSVAVGAKRVGDNTFDGRARRRDLYIKMALGIIAAFSTLYATVLKSWFEPK